jgi:hypothetical protein
VTKDPAPMHSSAWKGYSPKFAYIRFSSLLGAPPSARGSLHESLRRTDNSNPVHLSWPGLSRSIATRFAAVAASHPYLIMAMRIASALGKSLSLLRLASSGSLRDRGVMIRSSASPFVNVSSLLCEC